MGIEEALGEYWEVAFKEGASGVSHGDEANEVLNKIRTAVKSMVLIEREACAKICDCFCEQATYMAAMAIRERANV